MPGHILTLIGADGAGKSTLARKMVSAATGPVTRIYMGPNPAAFTHALPSTRARLLLKRLRGRAVHDGGPPAIDGPRRPRSRPARVVAHLKSLVVLFLRAPEELYRLLLAEWLAWRGHLVILDRHPYADYYARRVRGASRGLRLGDRLHGLLLRHVYPGPRNVVLLDAPADVLHARKPEGSLAEIQARREEYLELANDLPNITVVDVSRSEREIFDELRRIASRARPPSTEVRGVREHAADRIGRDPERDRVAATRP